MTNSATLTVLIGPPASGKSTWARDEERGTPTRILSSDYFRALISDDEGRRDVSNQAFDLLYKILDLRLERQLSTIVDSTAINPQARKKLLDIARKHHVVYTKALLFDHLTLEELFARNEARRRVVPPSVILRMYNEMLMITRQQLTDEGFWYVSTMSGR